MTNNILVTGGTGFLGSALSSKLVDLGYKVTVIDNNSRGSIGKIEHILNKVNYIEGDIRNKKDVKNAFKDCDTIFHLSFVNGTKFFYEKPELVLEVGIKGALNTLECSIEAGIDTYIMASSSEIYNQPTKVPTDETERAIITDIKNPRFSYAGGKLISEILTINYLKNTNIRNLIFRPHNIFGPDMGFEHVIPDLLKKIFIASNGWHSKKCTIQIQGTGNETRAFCYVTDAVDQLIYLMENGQKEEIYNIGMQKERTIKGLIEDISNYLDIEININASKALSGSTSRRCPDISKIKTIGYNVNDNYYNGLEKTISWYKKYYSKTAS